MNQYQGKVHLILDLDEQNDDRKSITPLNTIPKQPFQNTTTSLWTNEGIRNIETHAEFFDKSNKSPVMTLMMLQYYSENLTRVGSEILEMRTIKLRQRLTLVLKQKQIKMSYPIPLSQAECCNKQQDLITNCRIITNGVNNEHNHHFQHDEIEPKSTSKESCSSADTLSIDTDTKLEVSQSNVPKKASFLLESSIYKRKGVKEEDESELEIKGNKKTRLNSTDRPQIKESMRGLLSPKNCDKNEDIENLGFKDDDLKEETKSIRYEATHLNFLANLLSRMGRLHQLFLLEMMSCLDEDSQTSDDDSM